MRLTFATVGIVLTFALVIYRTSGSSSAATPEGAVQFFVDADSGFDRYTQAPTPAQQDWMRAQYWRLLAFSPYFDSRLSWFPDAWVYKDLYAIYVGSTEATAHPEWILRDVDGKPLYVPFGCWNGTCPQYAADAGNPSFRSQWIADAKNVLAAGYCGLYVDDVNLTLARVSNAAGTPTVPNDARTGRPMTEADWRRYLAEFTESIRSAFPAVEIVHNAIWFVGDDDPSVGREIAAADWLSLERGVNDPGITGGNGTFGFDTLLAHIDFVHSRGRAVVYIANARSRRQREYGLATYFLMNGGDDGVGNGRGGAPNGWWSAYETFLGAAHGPRYAWQGVLRRDFDSGFVLVNPPGAPSTALAFGGPYMDLRRRLRTSVTLRPAAGVVLRAP